MLNPAAVRARLTTQLAELEERAGRIDAHQHHRDRDVPRDWEDLAQFREDDEVVDGLEDMTRTEIARIRGALQRLDAGAWGTCARCGDAIEAARLEAIPTAIDCVACARAADTASH